MCTIFFVFMKEWKSQISSPANKLTFNICKWDAGGGGAGGHVLGYQLTLLGPRGQIMPSILLRAPPHLFGRCGMSEGLLTKVFSSVLNIMYFFFTQNNTNSFSRDFLIRVFIILIHIVIWPQKFLWGPGVKSNKYFWALKNAFFQD